MANAVSLLWRLELKGVDVGQRWRALVEIARQRRTDTTLVFASLHNLLALMAAGDEAAADDLVAALEQRAAGIADQARVARDVGLPLAQVIRGMRLPRATLDRICLALPMVGGSNAQRDLFVLRLAQAAQGSRDAAALDWIRTARRRLKAEDGLMAAVEQRAIA